MISPANIPNYWSWLYWLSPVHYVAEGMVMTQFHGNTEIIDVIDENGTQSMTIEQYVIEHFGGKFKYSMRGNDIIILIGMVIAFDLCRTLVLQYVKMMKR
jgi:hypothetical protein